MTKEKLKKTIYKPKPVSGFPEWLPEVRIVELEWFDHIRKVFESYGFSNIETPSIEELDVIAAKGEVDKEIYVLERLHKQEGDKEARLALHFDQTVPLARYVAQHFNDLTFPFKRYQIQRVWRGERPQAGRFREFYQCDIDVINVDSLPIHFDAEMPAIIWEILSGLPGMEKEKIQLRISNRKILSGLCQSLKIDNITEVTRIIDKLEKIGGVKAKEELVELLKENKLPEEHANTLINFAKTTDINSLAVENDLMQEGIDELNHVIEGLSHLPDGAVKVDLSIVRGLDYYTGTVYETVFTDDPIYGSICSGGRYDDLASGYIKKHLPGVGISIGFSRLFSKLLSENKLPVKAKSPAVILIALESEKSPPIAAEIARILRQRGYNTEIYHKAQKIQKQIAYAEKKGIPYVWFPESAEVKSLQAGKQYPADPAKWHRRKTREG
jgi:histidyl-tRNA synthetase